ncbi:NUDIX hydrolase [Longispora albida]|uniref:NUDIX hydrolase n=1 Tax=Longispora albida TaxID=203523 RepID=UPI0003699444|nr:NUDIX domain-containing protein [Longispora albida]
MRIRVAVYVIRNGNELLVFDHVGLPEAGTQIPAGGVDPGESLAEAALREVAEETGLLGITLTGEAGTEDSPHPETGEARRTTYFTATAPAGAPSEWTHRVTGDGEDGGMEFACWFEPLPLAAPLAGNQGVFL